MVIGTDFLVNKGDGVTGLVDEGIEYVPEKYIRPIEERFEENKSEPKASIPIIDVSNLDDEKVAESICDAASKWGFFQVINHGIPLKVVEDVKESVHRFFGLPAEERRKYLEGKSISKTMFMGSSFSPQTEAVLEWRDFLSFYFFPYDEDCYALWPSVCKDEVVTYMQKAEILIKKLLMVLVKNLNVKEFNEEKEKSVMGQFRINFNYYPKCPNPKLTSGIAPHSDMTTITMLIQDKIGGLYVRDTESINSWIHVPPVEGAFVINIGDILQVLSNNKYKSVEHRANPDVTRARVSIPIFVNPRQDFVIGPFPETLEGGEKPCYKNISFQDYYNNFFSRRLDGKKALDIITLE